MSEEKEVKSPISSGWRGHLNGHIEHTRASQINVSEVSVRLDSETAWALCNLLSDGSIERSNAVEGKQVDALSNLGAAIGRMIDHPSANNGGRKCVKP